MFVLKYLQGRPTALSSCAPLAPSLLSGRCFPFVSNLNLLLQFQLISFCPASGGIENKELTSTHPPTCHCRCVSSSRHPSLPGAKWTFRSLCHFLWRLFLLSLSLLLLQQISGPIHLSSVTLILHLIFPMSQSVCPQWATWHTDTEATAPRYMLCGCGLLPLQVPCPAPAPLHLHLEGWHGFPVLFLAFSCTCFLWPQLQFLSPRSTQALPR